MSVVDNFQRLGFSDPRAREADRLSWEAEQALKSNDMVKARELYGRAAEIEEAIALNAYDEPIRVRSILAVNAATLWYKADEWDRVQRLVCPLLSEPDQFTDDARAELQDLLDQVIRR